MAKIDFPEQAQHLIREHPHHPRHLRSINPRKMDGTRITLIWQIIADFLPTNNASVPNSDQVDG